MAVSVIETAQGTNGSTGTGPAVTVAATPQPGDVVYVCLSAGATGRVVTAVSGLGAVWSEVVTVNAATGAGSQIVWRGVGATTAGTVALTVSSSSNGSVRAFLVRGMTAPDYVSATALGTGVAACPGPAQAAGAGCFVLALAFASTKTTGNLLEGTQPAAGWVIQTSPPATTGYHHTGYHIPTDPGPVQCTVQAGTSGTRQILQIVFGVAAPSGFTGWGIPA